MGTTMMNTVKWGIASSIFNNITQSVSQAFDYVKAPDQSFRIVEICYGYVSEIIYGCRGYWDSDFVFHETHLMPDECILEDFINS